MHVHDLAGRNVVVMGLGRFGGGVGVTRWLCEQGARVTVSDAADETSLAKSIAQLDGCDVAFHLGGHDERDLEGADLLVVSPAVDRRTNPFFAAAVASGIAWTTEINLFVQRCRGRLVGVTGTAGKSTTCTLIHAALSEPSPTAPHVWFGGNVGKSLLADLSQIKEQDVVILELSSFQLDAISQIAVSPQIALITNAWPNHLDRHDDFEAYLSAKLNLFRYQRAGDAVLVGCRDPSLEHAVGDIAARTGATLTLVEESGVPYDLCLPGLHNQRNATCAAAAARLLGVDDGVIRKRMANVTGLPHRLEHVARIDDVDFHNDSKSTTPQGTATAVAAFDQPIVLIAGGQDRGDNYQPICSAAAERCRAVVCTGPAGRRMAEALRSIRADGLDVMTADNLADAVAQARSRAQSGDVVLLSPGAPSYDEFVNYEHRGRAFAELIRGPHLKQ